MNLFNTDSESEEEEEEDSVEYEKREVTEEKEYTAHTAIAVFIVPGVGLVEREYEFDAFHTERGKYILTNYTGFDTTWGFNEKKFATIHRNEHLATFETTERRTETMEFTVTKRVPVDEEDE